jgi:hypothetical protein
VLFDHPKVPHIDCSHIPHVGKAPINITLAIDEKLAERASVAAQAMGKSLNQAVRDYLEQLAGRAQMESDLQAFRASAQDTPGRLNGWKFDREESHRRA